MHTNSVRDAFGSSICEVLKENTTNTQDGNTKVAHNYVQPWCYHLVCWSCFLLKPYKFNSQPHLAPNWHAKWHFDAMSWHFLHLFRCCVGWKTCIPSSCSTSGETRRYVFTSLRLFLPGPPPHPEREPTRRYVFTSLRLYVFSSLPPPPHPEREPTRRYVFTSLRLFLPLGGGGWQPTGVLTNQIGRASCRERV